MNFKRLSLAELAELLPSPERMAQLFSQFQYLIQLGEKPSDELSPRPRSRRQVTERYQSLVSALQMAGLSQLASEMDPRDSLHLFLVTEDLLAALSEAQTSANLRESTNWLNLTISNLCDWNRFL